MVFHPDGQYQQFPHCKFRENIVRLLYIPSIVTTHLKSTSSPAHLFLAVNKFGKVGLYHPEKFALVHTYCLDLTVSSSTSTLEGGGVNHHKPLSNSINRPTTPKCARTHLVTDGVFCPDTLCVIFSTTKSLLQWYDIGEIQKQDIGLSLFPRGEFLTLSESSYPMTQIPHNGHVESHRLFGLRFIPTCMEYHTSARKLIVADVDGGVTLIGIPTSKYPLGRRKIRGTLHKIHLSQLPRGIVQYYKAHQNPISDIQWIPERNLILTSSSKDKKFSIYAKDISDSPMESIIVSIPKGVNSITYSHELKMVATGSDDYVVRLFNQFVMKMPQMELLGHRSAVISVKFVKVDFYVEGAEQGDHPVLLLSYSADSELRGWDPLTFICLQSIYLSFPTGSTIMCKTPEFATKSLLIFQPKNSGDEQEPSSKTNKARKKDKVSSLTSSSDIIILLYCNSYARIPLEKEGSTRWPGIDYDKFIREFEDLSMEYDNKLKEKLKVDVHPLPPYHHHPQQQQHRSPRHQYRLPPVVIEEELEEVDDKKIPEKTEEGSTRFKDNACLLMTKEDIPQMERKVEVYLREIMELRKTIKETRTGETDNGDEEDDAEDVGVGDTSGSNPLSISIQATNRFYEFKRCKLTTFQDIPKGLQRMLSYGNAFNQYPILELEPVQFSRGNLAITDKMKKELGIKSVNCVQDLMTPEAQKYFAKKEVGSEFGSGRMSSSSNKGGSGGSMEGRRGSGGSFFYNFNHNQQKPKLKGKMRESHHHHHMNLNQPSRFTVIGQRMKNAYEDENFLFPPTKDEYNGEEEGDCQDDENASHKFY